MELVQVAPSGCRSRTGNGQPDLHDGWLLVGIRIVHVDTTADHQESDPVDRGNCFIAHACNFSRFRVRLGSHPADRSWLEQDPRSRIFFPVPGRTDYRRLLCDIKFETIWHLQDRSDKHNVVSRIVCNGTLCHAMATPNVVRMSSAVHDGRRV